MKKKRPSRILELTLYKSKRNPKLSHVVAKLIPCDHRTYLGIAKTPKDMITQSMRVNYITIWRPEHFAVTEKHHCYTCPTDLIWVKDLPKTQELKDLDDD